MQQAFRLFFFVFPRKCQENARKNTEVNAHLNTLVLSSAERIDIPLAVNERTLKYFDCFS